jgi:hypothetical protein
MSHTPNHIDTGPTSAYYQGLEAGVNQERDRIIGVLESYAPQLITSGLMERIGDGWVPDETNYDRGLGDSADALYKVLDRLKHSLYDTEYLTDVETSQGQKLIELIYDRYGEEIWKVRDGE